MEISRLITGLVAILLGVFLVVLSLFVELWILIYGIPILIIGIWILANKNEDKIEERLDKKESIKRK